MFYFNHAFAPRLFRGFLTSASSSVFSLTVGLGQVGFYEAARLFPKFCFHLKLTKNDFPAENSVVCLVGQVKEQDVGKA